MNNNIQQKKYIKTLIIIPCYNEAANILDIYQETCKKVNCDVLVINDASNDGSLEILRSNDIPHIDLSINLGIGGAMQAGYRYALRNGYDVAVQIDGDGQHDPAYAEKIITPILNSKADIVIGSRFIDRKGFQSSPMRRVGIVFFKWLLLILGRKSITDATSGFRAVNRRTMMLFDSSYAKDYPEPESVMLALHHNLHVVEVPVIMRERSSGVSSITKWRSIYYMFKVSIGIFVAATSLRLHVGDNEVVV